MQTIQQLIEDELIVLSNEEKRHLARGNWQRAADAVTKREYLLRFKERVLTLDLKGEKPV